MLVLPNVIAPKLSFDSREVQYIAKAGPVQIVACWTDHFSKSHCCLGLNACQPDELMQSGRQMESTHQPLGTCRVDTNNPQ